MAIKALIEKQSNKSFEETSTTLKNVLDKNPNLKILLELDHSKNAASVDLELPPTRIILFGNPNLGTVLMKDKQSIGIDLPQKILIVEKGGAVIVSYNNPEYLKEKHQLSTATTEVLAKVTAALDKITNLAIEA